MARSLVVILAGVLAVLSAGCELNVKPGAESIFDAFSDSQTPGQLAAMAIDPYDPNARYIGTLGLANEAFANEPVYINLFIDNLSDSEPAVRAAAARGLGNHGEPKDVPLLLKTLRDPDKLVRLESARALQRLYNPVAVDGLVVAMHEPDAAKPREAFEADSFVRAEAATALGQYVEPRVVQALIAGLDDSELAVNQASLASLRVLTGQDLGLERSTWVDWLSKNEKDPFKARGMYTYPVFRRDYRWYEYLPYVPKPKNEVETPSAGLPRS